METIGRPSPFGYSICCDDIRHELGGKISFIGVYLTEMHINAPFPIVLPKFCIAIHYFALRDEFTGPVQLTVTMPGSPLDQPLVNVALDPEQFKGVPLPSDHDPEQEQDFVGGMFVTELTNLRIEKPGRITVRAIRGDKSYRWGGLRVLQGPYLTRGLAAGTLVDNPAPAPEPVKAPSRRRGRKLDL